MNNSSEQAFVHMAGESLNAAMGDAAPGTLFGLPEKTFATALLTQSVSTFIDTMKDHGFQVPAHAPKLRASVERVFTSEQISVLIQNSVVQMAKETSVYYGVPRAQFSQTRYREILASMKYLYDSVDLAVAIACLHTAGENDSYEEILEKNDHEFMDNVTAYVEHELKNDYIDKGMDPADAADAVEVKALDKSAPFSALIRKDLGFDVDGTTENGLVQALEKLLSTDTADAADASHEQIDGVLSAKLEELEQASPSDFGAWAMCMDHWTQLDPANDPVELEQIAAALENWRLHGNSVPIEERERTMKGVWDRAFQHAEEQPKSNIVFAFDHMPHADYDLTVTFPLARPTDWLAASYTGPMRELRMMDLLNRFIKANSNGHMPMFSVNGNTYRHVPGTESWSQDYTKRSAMDVKGDDENSFFAAALANTPLWGAYTTSLYKVLPEQDDNDDLNLAQTKAFIGEVAALRKLNGNGEHMTIFAQPTVIAALRKAGSEHVSTHLNNTVIIEWPDDPTDGISLAHAYGQAAALMGAAESDWPFSVTLEDGTTWNAGAHEALADWLSARFAKSYDVTAVNEAFGRGYKAKTEAL